MCLTYYVNDETNNKIYQFKLVFACGIAGIGIVTALYTSSDISKKICQLKY